MKSTDTPLFDLPADVFEAIAAMGLLVAMGYDPDDVFVNVTRDADTVDMGQVSVGVRPPGGPNASIHWAKVVRTVSPDDLFIEKWKNACARYNALSFEDRKRVIDASAVRARAVRLLAVLVAAGVPPSRTPRQAEGQ